MSTLKDLTDRLVDRHVENYSYRSQYINSQQNTIHSLCCISFKISSSTCFGRYCCHFQGDVNITTIQTVQNVLSCVAVSCVAVSCVAVSCVAVSCVAVSCVAVSCVAVSCVAVTV